MKIRKIIISIFSSLLFVFGGTLLTSCVNNNSSSSSSFQELTQQQKIYNLAVSSGYEGTYEQWLDSIKGDSVELSVNSGILQWKYTKDSNWRDLINISSLQGSDGSDGREIELQKSEDYLMWRYKGESTWNTLISLEDIKGEDGNGIVSIEKTNSEGNVDTYTITYSDGTTSTFLVTNGEAGEQGTQGLPGKDGHTPVISIGENGNWFIDGIDTGKTSCGDKGDKGEDGEKGTPGDKGDTGLSAYELYLKYHPEYIGTEEEWIEDLVNGNLTTKFLETHTVSFDTGTDFSIECQEVEDGKKVIKPENPIKEGYTFMGWYYDVNDNDIYEDDEKWSFFGYSVTEDITLEAKWSINHYYIQFVDGDDILYDVPVEYGTNYELPILEQTGYTFLGWSIDGILLESTHYVVKDNTTFNAEWKINEYVVTFNTNCNLELDDQIIEYNQFVELPKLEREGYVLMGWLIGDTEWLNWDSEYQVKDNVVFDAYWLKILNYEEFLDAEIGEFVGIQGIVTYYYVYSSESWKKTVYLQDENNGGYYVDLCTGDSVKEGDKICIRGLKGIYNGMHIVEYVSFCSIISTGNDLGEASDITDLLKNAKDNSTNEVSNEYVGRKIKLTEFVVSELPDIKDGVINEGKDYSIMGYVGFTNVTMRVKAESTDIANINALVKTLEVGDNLAIEGVGEWYNGLQLIPVSADKIQNNGTYQHTDAEKVILDKRQIELPTIVNFNTNKNLELPTTGLFGSTITWASSDEMVLGSDGKINSIGEASLTATIKFGDVIETKTFALKIQSIIIFTKTNQDCGVNEIAVLTEGAVRENQAWMGNGWRLYVVVDAEGRIAYMVVNPSNGYGNPSSDGYYANGYYSDYTTNPAINILEGFGPWVQGGTAHNLFDIVVPEGGFALVSYGTGSAEIFKALGLTATGDADINKRGIVADNVRLVLTENNTVTFTGITD